MPFMRNPNVTILIEASIINVIVKAKSMYSKILAYSLSGSARGDSNVSKIDDRMISKMTKESKTVF